MDINRTIQVTNRGFSPILSIAQGTDMVRFNFRLTDFDVPSGSAAVAYNIQPTGNIVPKTCSISGNTISVDPPAYYFLRGKNYMQIQITNNGKRLVTFLIEVWCSPNIATPEVVEMGDSTVTQQLLSEVGVLSARINNLAKLQEGSTTGDAELRDIRIGYDGTEYENAGEAVRGQIGSLSEDKVGYRGILNTSNYPHTELKYLLKPGDYSIDEPLTATLTDLPENFIGLNKMLNCEVRRAFSGQHYIQKIYSTSSYADPLIRIVLKNDSTVEIYADWKSEIEIINNNINNIEKMDLISNVFTSKIFTSFFNISDKYDVDYTLTNTYGYMQGDGTVTGVGNQTYNYTIIEVKKGDVYYIHSAMYKKIYPYIFISSKGEVTPYPYVNSLTDSTIYTIDNWFIVPEDGKLYVNYYRETIRIANITDIIKGIDVFNSIKSEKLDVKIDETTTKSNVLYGKKYTVVGDSFSDGAFSGSSEPHTITEGKYSGKNAVYGYLIGNRNNMEIQHLATGGRTLATPSDGSFTNCVTNENVYKAVDHDSNYLTIYIGINDSHHRPGSSGGDGEDNTGVIEIGNIDDSTINTFYGAWNTVLKYWIENYPYLKIGIIVSNGCETDDYRKATIAIAKKWGIPYIDLNGDERTPMMNRSTNPEVSNIAKELRNKALRVSETNWHPSVKAHEYESYIIEDFLRSL